MSMDYRELIDAYTDEELARIIIGKDNELQKYKALEEQIYPTTLEKLVSVTVEMANKTEGKQADHIHLLSDKESYKWEELLKLEEEIGMPLEMFVKIMLSSTFYVLAYEPCEIVEVNNDGISFDKERPRFNMTSKADVTDAWSITLQDFSKYAFLTYEEAEKKLEEMKNENA